MRLKVAAIELNTQGHQIMLVPDDDVTVEHIASMRISMRGDTFVVTGDLVDVQIMKVADESEPASTPPAEPPPAPPAPTPLPPADEPTHQS